MSVFRVYEPHECGPDGYPFIWHGVSTSSVLAEAMGVKHMVREAAGHRCARCGHPYIVGQSGAWEVTSDPGLRKRADAQFTLDPEERAAERAREVAVVGGDQPVGVNWSPCDERCTHGGPCRIAVALGQWIPLEVPKRLALANGHQPVQAAWRILTVHHLNGHKHDLRWWNLAALCQRCHLTIQRKVQIEAVYPLEHSDWFKPYAAGWYAYAYLGLDLTREQVAERMDELLGLERLA